jgi:hypothetical protein
MNLVGRPIAHAVILRGGDGNDAKSRVSLKQRVADAGPFSALISGNYQQVRKHFLDGLEDFFLLRYFSKDFYPRLLGECGKQNLAQQLRVVSEKDPDWFVQRPSPFASGSEKYEQCGEKRRLNGVLARVSDKYLAKS